MLQRTLADRRIARPQFPNVALRAMALADLSQIFRWLIQPHVAAYRDPYASLPEITGHFESKDVWPFIVIAGGRPIGYFQICAATDDPFWAGHQLPRETFGLDLFIGEPEALRRGHGSASLALAVAHLLDRPDVARVHGDPGPDNAAALGAFAKAGFKRRDAITTPDGPAIYMAIERG